MGDTSSEEDEKEKEVKNYFVITFIIIIIIITLQAIVFVAIEIIEFIILMGRWKSLIRMTSEGER